MPLDHLFSPLRLGGIEVANRLFVSAHHTGFVTERRVGLREWSFLDERAAAYVEERARGGFGLVIVGQTQVHPRSGLLRPAAYGAEAQACFADMAARCHRHGTALIVQLNQNGNEQVWTGPDNWEPGWGPSALATLDPGAHGEMCKAMDADDIDALVAAFVAAAVNVRDAGVDGVEIHAAHPHLLGQWLVPAFNKRTDEHGGSLVNRMRLVLRILRSVRAACPRPFVVGLRCNGAWDMPGGLRLEEGVEAAAMAADGGDLDFLDVSGWPGIGTIGSPQGALVPYAAEVKRAVPGLPVFTAGRIVDPVHAEAVVAGGQADMVAMTRASIADPALPAKARMGRLEDIRRCVGASQGCLMRNGGRRPITCTQNPAVGREAVWGEGTRGRTGRPRRVVVVGGGVAGMEAAWVAAERGHQVTLWEASADLGGQVNLISRVARRAEMAEIVRWRAHRLARLDVDLRLGTEADAAGVRVLLDGEPAAVVVATGARPRRDGFYAGLPHLERIPGAGLPLVRTPWEVLQGGLDACRHVVVVDGCTYYQSSDPVERLVQAGVKVTAVSVSASFAEGIESHDRPAFLAAARSGGVVFRPLSVVTAIEEDRVLLSEAGSGVPAVIEGVDAVVLSLGSDVVDGLYHELRAEGVEVHRVGDCLVPRGIEHALFEAHRVARSL